jgi:hypothetical protein
MTRVTIDVPVPARHLRAAAAVLRRLWRPETAAFLVAVADRLDRKAASSAHTA